MEIPYWASVHPFIVAAQMILRIWNWLTLHVAFNRAHDLYMLELENWLDYTKEELRRMEGTR